MNLTETQAILMVFGFAQDRQIPDGMAEVWQMAIADLPFELAQAAAVELVRTSPYFPKTSDLRDRARLIREQRQREARRRRQLEGPPPPPPVTGRTGAEMVRHVLGRLADAGQDVPSGKYLGAERAGDIAVAAVEEWLNEHPRTGHEPPRAAVIPTHAPVTDLARCHYRPSASTGICASCDFPHGHARHRPEGDTP